MHLKTLDPDVRIAYCFADFLAQPDPVLTYVLQEARQASPHTTYPHL
jgi:hypothetical protein